MERSEHHIFGDLGVLAVKDFFGSGLTADNEKPTTDDGQPASGLC
jgi:hypothetical protein